MDKFLVYSISVVQFDRSRDPTVSSSGSRSVIYEFVCEGYLDSRLSSLVGDLAFRCSFPHCISYVTVRNLTQKNKLLNFGAYRILQ